MHDVVDWVPCCCEYASVRHRHRYIVDDSAMVDGDLSHVLFIYPAAFYSRVIVHHCDWLWSLIKIRGSAPVGDNICPPWKIL